MPARAGLGTRLLLLLLGFGALPLAASMAVGYAVSRGIIVERSERSLREIVARQAVHIATELNRERLLLRTIAGQLPAAAALARLPREPLAQQLTQALPEDGVFDGLRVVTTGGRVLASVALRDAAPHWPDRVPATAWDVTNVLVHREDGRALAYLLAAPLDQVGAVWIEGHVRSEDFPRLLAIPEHMANGLESAVFDTAGGRIAVGHTHAALLARAGAWSADSATLSRETLGGEPFLAARIGISGTDWVYGGGVQLAVALASIERLRNTAAAGILVLIALIAITATVAARSITMPLRELAVAIERFGHTGVYQATSRQRIDEIGLIANAFSTMAGDLLTSRGNLEKLHQQEMERAQQLATVGELASGVAHEIRNPLTGVLGAIELATRRLPPDDPTRPLLAEGESQLRRIEKATVQLLQYARPPELKQVSVDVAEIVARAIHVVEPRSDAAAVSVELESLARPATVHVDPEAMVQVLVNLLLNAIQAMPEGGALIVWLAHHAPGVWIGVRDHGPGVAVDQQAAIFRPFFTTKSQGTGLGLSISRQIVERHGGSIRYEDTPGGGATFVVSLPADSH